MTTFERFCEFHKENPKVFRLFRQFASAAKATGRKRFGARMIGERIRWYTRIETTSVDFKLNNDYWPYYARLLMLTNPGYERFFESRSGRSDATDDQIRTLAGV